MAPEQSISKASLPTQELTANLALSSAMQAPREEEDLRIELFYWLCYYLVCVGLSIAVGSYFMFDSASWSAFLQGTTALFFNLASVAVLVAAMLGTQLQIKISRHQTEISQRQARIQEEELNRQYIDIVADRRLATLDSALRVRFELLRGCREVSSSNLSDVTTEVAKLLDWARARVSHFGNVDDLKSQARQFFVDTDFMSNPYIVQLRQVLDMASRFALEFQQRNPNDLDFWRMRFVDYAWNDLLMEERAIAVLILIGTDGLERPSGLAMQTWGRAIDRIASWSPLKVQDILK